MPNKVELFGMLTKEDEVFEARRNYVTVKGLQESCIRGEGIIYMTYSDHCAREERVKDLVKEIERLQKDNIVLLRRLAAEKENERLQKENMALSRRLAEAERWGGCNRPHNHSNHVVTDQPQAHAHSSSGSTYNLRQDILKVGREGGQTEFLALHNPRQALLCPSHNFVYQDENESQALLTVDEASVQPHSNSGWHQFGLGLPPQPPAPVQDQSSCDTSSSAWMPTDGDTSFQLQADPRCQQFGLGLPPQPPVPIQDQSTFDTSSLARMQTFGDTFDKVSV
ncbi:hypothetical protein BT69DRAFT_1344307 [Atractiella rhizophila]|nr:hypothetical protein BT69DRAFT_1344307 [Atractiella rhizophila]